MPSPTSKGPASDSAAYLAAYDCGERLSRLFGMLYMDERPTDLEAVRW